MHPTNQITRAFYQILSFISLLSSRAGTHSVLHTCTPSSKKKKKTFFFFVTFLLFQSRDVQTQNKY